jgi:hypothetical protein
MGQTLMATMPDRNYNPLNNSSMEKHNFYPKLGTKREPKQPSEHI